MQIPVPGEGHRVPERHQIVSGVEGHSKVEGPLGQAVSTHRAGLRASVTRVKHHVDRLQRLPTGESDGGPTGRADHRAVRRRGEDGQDLGIRTEERHWINLCGGSRN